MTKWETEQLPKKENSPRYRKYSSPAEWQRELLLKQFPPPPKKMTWTK